MKLSTVPSHPLFFAFFAQIILAYEWFFAGWGKIYGGQFVPNMGKTLARFENGNPHGWYVDSLLSVAKNAPTLFGQLVQWGELLAGIGLVAAVILYVFCKVQRLQKIAKYTAIASLFGGVFMSLNFYFAAGWTSPSTGGLNALMFWLQMVLIMFWIQKRQA